MDGHNDVGLGHSNFNVEADTTIHNSSLDLLEQQQAIEQARLLNRFRELRSWQQKQQEQLMLQQQTQLELLREEQAKVQNALKLQRQQQWGAGTVKSSSLSIKSTNYGESVRFETDISELVNTVIPKLPTKQNGVIPDNKQHTLPKPVIFEESPKIEEDNYTNPELFSNPGSMDQLEDGVFHGYDTGSELSNPSSAQQLTLQNLLQSASPETLKAMLAMIPRSRLMTGNVELSPRAKIRHAVHGASPKAKINSSPGKFREIKISPRQRLNKSPSPRSSGSVITELDRKGDMVNESAQQNGYHAHNASPRLRDKVRFDDLELPQNVKRHLFTEDDDDKDSIDSEVMAALDEMNRQNDCNQKMAASVPVPVPETESNNQQDQVDLEPESPNNNHKFAVSIDDRPIKPGLGAGGKKTFEQLLEEQLLEEERKILEEEVVESPSSKKKPFLKRGQGLARFMGNKAGKETQPIPKSKPTELKLKQPEKPAPINKEKRKNDPSTGPLSNTAKSNQVSKPGTKPKPSQSVPKTVSNQSNNPLHLTQTLKLNPKMGPKSYNSNVPKSQMSSTAPKPQISSNVPQKTTTASNIQASIHSNQTAYDNQSCKPEKFSTNYNKTGEVTSSCVQPNLDPFDDDSSFAEAVRTRIANEGKEQEELAEFELLEDFADNASFCSNSSIVVKLLQSDKNIKTGEPLVGLKSILEARQKEKLQKLQQIPEQPVPVVQVDEEDKDDTIVDENITDITSDTLTDSDSSISSDSALDDQDIQFLTAKLNLHQNQAFTNTNQNSSLVQNKGQESLDPVPSKSLTRKIASRDGVPSVATSSSTDMKNLLQRLTASKGPHISSLKNSVKLSSDVQYKDQEKQESEGESEESTSEEGDDDDDDDEDYDDNDGTKANNYVNDFDDEEEWIDKAPKPKATGLNEKKVEDKLQSTPPTSKLVARLFPNLNQQQQDKQQKQQQEAEILQNTKQSDGLQSKILRDKLADLEIEIERFRNENSVLDKLRKEREEGLAKLKKEINDFEKEKSEELKRLEEFKNQEMKKLKHERKMFEKYQKTIRSMPDKKDREEIDMLKNQINELQEEMKRKETRWTSSQTRLKDKLELVELENKELRDEIQLLEKKRIEWMQKEAAASASSQKVIVNGHQSYPRSSTPTKETEDKHPNVNNHNISPPRSHPPLQKKSVINQVKHYETASKSLSLTTDSIPALHQSVGDPQPRTQPIKITKLSENSSTSLSTSSTSTTTTSSVPRKLASRLLLDNPTIDKGNKQYEESQHSDGKIERIYKNGAREILFSNGTRKEISSDGQSIVVSFFNGDIKQIYPDKRVVYYYADAQTSHTTYPDSLEVLQFQNGQIEKHYPDGTKEITFPDQTVKYLFPNGSEESIFPDGTVIRVDVNGDKTMEFPNGQREIHNSQFKRREYPDGTVKTVYPDGRQETRYSTGRVRLKDKDGNVIMDRIC